VHRRIRKGVLVAGGVYLASSVAIAAWLMPTGRETPPVSFAPPRDKPVWGRETPADVRTLALRQARVWMPADPAAVDFEANPPDPNGLLSQPIVRCRYLDGPVRGTTPKFDCVLPDGEVVKVKYGRNPEIHAELAATRLLAALGFGADRTYLVSRLRCYGCVRTPFYTTRVLDYVHAREVVSRSVPEDSYTDFEWVAVERRLDGAEIEVEGEDGWAWYELDPIDPARGANRAERDALRLAAMLLAHWDNKAANQRLLCLSPSSPGTACARPFAYAHDLGATFGPKKVDFEQWRDTPVWADASQCLVSMRQFPYHGGTFPDTRISEAGRQLLVRQLSALTERHAVALFTGARFPEFNGRGAEDGDANAWARALLEKAHQIASAGPCAE